MLPWGEMLRAALAAGIAPDAFWQLGMREWRLLTERRNGASHTTLQQLMQEFPDQQEARI